MPVQHEITDAKAQRLAEAVADYQRAADLAARHKVEADRLWSEVVRLQDELDATVPTDSVADPPPPELVADESEPPGGPSDEALPPGYADGMAFGQYCLLDLIHAGGTGSVYKARDVPVKIPLCAICITPKSTI